MVVLLGALPCAEVAAFAFFQDGGTFSPVITGSAYSKIVEDPPLLRVVHRHLPVADQHPGINRRANASPACCLVQLELSMQRQNCFFDDLLQVTLKITKVNLANAPRGYALRISS